MKWFPIEKKKDKKMIFHGDYVDELALLANTPAQAEFLLNSLQQAARIIVVYMNTIQTEFIRYKQEAISTLNSRPDHIPWV